jgi:hypothetical protein
MELLEGLAKRGGRILDGEYLSIHGRGTCEGGLEASRRRRSGSHMARAGSSNTGIHKHHFMNPERHPRLPGVRLPRRRRAVG